MSSENNQPAPENRGRQPAAEALNSQGPLLVGNSFPLSLVRRRVVIEPVELKTVRRELRERGFLSFWGHPATLPAASRVLGVDLTPSRPRPAVILDPELVPSLDGISFRECRVLSPTYSPGFRPAPGEEVAEKEIREWTALRLSWK